MSETIQAIKLAMENVQLDATVKAQAKRIEFLERLVERLTDMAAAAHAEKYPTSLGLRGFTCDSDVAHHRKIVTEAALATDSSPQSSKGE